VDRRDGVTATKAQPASDSEWWCCCGRGRRLRSTNGTDAQPRQAPRLCAAARATHAARVEQPRPPSPITSMHPPPALPGTPHGAAGLAESQCCSRSSRLPYRCGTPGRRNRRGAAFLAAADVREEDARRRRAGGCGASTCLLECICSRPHGRPQNREMQGLADHVVRQCQGK